MTDFSAPPRAAPDRGHAATGSRRWRALARWVLAAAVLGNVATGACGSAYGAAIGASAPVPRAVAAAASFYGAPEWFRGVSCPTAALCVGATDSGDLVTSANPGGGAHAWIPESDVRSTHVNGLTGVSCATTTFCVAITNDSALRTTAPAHGREAWTSVRIERSYGLVQAISCPSLSLCVAVDSLGNVITSTDPAGPASAWHFTHVLRLAGYEAGPDHPAVSCASDSFCVVALGDEVGTSTAPDGGAAAWSVATVEPPPINGDPGAELTGLSCPAASLCVGTVIFSSNCSYYHGALESCAYTEGIATSTTPSSGASGWRTVSLGDGSLAGVSCAATTLCVAVDDGGNVITSADPTAGASAWTRRHFNSALDAVSCASVSLCVAAGDLPDTGGADILSSLAPLAGAWSGAIVIGADARPYREVLAAYIGTVAASIDGVLSRHGYIQPFAAPTRGTLLVSWYQRRPARRPLLVAIGRRTYLKPFAADRIRLTLTTAGMRLLRSSRRISLQAQARFTTAGVATATATSTFRLRRTR